MSNSETPPSSKCPVDHSSWNNSDYSPKTSSPEQTSQSPNVDASPSLPTSRAVSSIPRTDTENWVYPSEAQFFAAMARKQHNPQAPDMRVIVPIHNAVNERTWEAVKAWETAEAAKNVEGSNSSVLKVDRATGVLKHG